MTYILIWLSFFGVWPLADPGHDDWTSPLVLFDLLVHAVAFVLLLRLYIEHEVQRRLERWEHQQ